MLRLMIEYAYSVSGMSCGHCAQSVTEEIRGIPGVTDVTVDVATGRVVVQAETPLSDADIQAAVEEAGYRFEGVASLVS